MLARLRTINVWLVFLLPLAVAIASSIARARQDSNAVIRIGGSAPRFTLQDQEGRNVSPDDLTGKIIVLEWFDPDCDYTKRDVIASKTPQRLASKYKEKGVIWLGVNSTRQGSQGRNRAWIKDNDLPYVILDDAKQEVAKAYGVARTPYYVIIDRNGNVAYTGSLDDDESRDGSKREGKINFIDLALQEMTSGNAVTRPQGFDYGCPLR
jgi:peroxiredoxin